MPKLPRALRALSLILMGATLSAGYLISCGKNTDSQAQSGVSAFRVTAEASDVATCPAGTIAVGGGCAGRSDGTTNCNINGVAVLVTSMRAEAPTEGWRCGMKCRYSPGNVSDIPAVYLKTYAVCMSGVSNTDCGGSGQAACQ